MKHETGILIAIGEESGFQIVGSVASVQEAKEIIAGYIKFGPTSESNVLAPYEFQIHLRDSRGWYTRIETIAV
jgi:hypothetical protein